MSFRLGRNLSDGFSEGFPTSGNDRMGEILNPCRALRNFLIKQQSEPIGKYDNYGYILVANYCTISASRKMPRQKKNVTRKNSNGGNLGFEEKLWQAADKMRGHMDPAEYKHIVLGLIFLKYISDAFEERHKQLEIWTAEPSSEYFVAEERSRYGVIEDKDEYLAENIFYVPRDARWNYLQANAKQPTIGKLVDDAMLAIEKGNPQLKGVLPKDYARPTLDKHTLGELIDLIGTIGLGDAESRSKDILGRVYEYF
jgi:type I restriction enzyme M protein